MRNKITLPNLILLLILLYHSQGWLYTSGSIISRSILLVWLAISLLYALRYLFGNKKDIISNTIFVFWLMNVCYWLFSEKQVYSFDGYFSLSTFDNFKNITTGFLTYFPFKYWIEKKYINETHLKYFSVILFFVIIIGFYWSNYVSLLDTELDSVTNNFSYKFVLLFPLLGLFFNNRVIYVFLALSLYFVVIGSKRGAILCIFIQTLLFFYFKLKDLPRHKKIQGSIIFLLMFLLVTSFVIKTYNSNIYLQKRMEQTIEGDASGRDELYSDALLVYSNGDSFELLFGHGMCKSVSLIGNYAHNDWLELLLDNGALGVILYFLFFVALISVFVKKRRYISVKFRFMYFVVLIPWLMKSLVSMGYTSLDLYQFLIVLLLVQNNLSVNKNYISK